MPVDIKDLTTEITSGVADAKTAVVSLQSQLADALKAQVGNVPDEDVTAIRNAFADLKATYSPPPPPPPAPQPGPNPPTN